MAKQGSRRGTTGGTTHSTARTGTVQAGSAQAGAPSGILDTPTQARAAIGPRGLQSLRTGFAVVLAVLVLANFVVRPTGHFGIDGSFAFFSWFAALSCFGLVIVAKVLGVFLKRDADYYDQPATPGPAEPKR